MFKGFDIVETLSAFVILFAIIDVVGSIPIIVNLQSQGKTVKPLKATVLSGLLLVVFFYAGDLILKLFNVDIDSFAVAGAILIFMLALEMLLDVEIFKYAGPTADATLVPLVFPLLAGAGTFTTLIALKAEYADINILTGLFLNIIWIYVVLKLTDPIQRFFGKGGIYIMRKFFGIVLMAISIKLFTANLSALTSSLNLNATSMLMP